VDNLNILLVG